MQMSASLLCEIDCNYPQICSTKTTATVRKFVLRNRLQLSASLLCEIDCNCPQVYSAKSTAIVRKFALRNRLQLSASLLCEIEFQLSTNLLCEIDCNYAMKWIVFRVNYINNFSCISNYRNSTNSCGDQPINYGGYFPKAVSRQRNKNQAMISTGF